MQATQSKLAKIEGFKYFYPERARLMHIDQPLFEELSKSPLWVAEPKYNGKRLQLHHLPDGSWQFWNRHEQVMSYTPSAALLADLEGLNLSGYWLFDGELRDGKVKGIRHRIALYDVFIAEGDLLLGITFGDRRGILEVLFHYCGPDAGDLLDLAPQYEGDFRQLFDGFLEDKEIEGLVLKNVKGRLNLGRTRAADSSWQWKVRKASNVVRF
jgi:ATP-dependent DNA ligase